jgi:hypothetical protein
MPKTALSAELSRRINEIATTARGTTEIERFLEFMGDPNQVVASEAENLRKRVEGGDYLMRFCNLIMKKYPTDGDVVFSVHQVMFLSKTGVPTDAEMFKTAALEVLVRVEENKPKLLGALNTTVETPLVTIADIRAEEYFGAAIPEFADCLIGIQAQRGKKKRSTMIITNFPYSLTKQ